jgi:hypothetical protein
MTESTISQKLISPSKPKFKYSNQNSNYSKKIETISPPKALKTIRDRAYQLITARVAPAFPKNDGKQTPIRRHPVFSRPARNHHMLPGVHVHIKVAWYPEGPGTELCGGRLCCSIDYGMD